MVWAILFLLGIPLWFILVGIVLTVARNRKLRARRGNFPARVKRPGKDRWTRGNAIWISDVFAFRGSPATWSEDLVQVVGVSMREPSDEESHKLRHFSEHPQIATLSVADGTAYEVATAAESRVALAGPLATDTTPTSDEPSTVPRAGRNSTYDEEQR